MSNHQCAGEVYEGHSFGRCTRRGAVSRNGKWYCTQHDPERYRGEALKTVWIVSDKNEVHEVRIVRESPRTLWLHEEDQRLNDHRATVYKQPPASFHSAASAHDHAVKVAESRYFAALQASIRAEEAYKVAKEKRAAALQAGGQS